MHYLGAVTSQSHTVYYIRFVVLFVLRCTGIPLQCMIRTYSAAGCMYKFVS